MDENNNGGFFGFLSNIAGAFAADRAAEREAELRRLGASPGYLGAAPAVSTTPGASSGTGAASPGVAPSSLIPGIDNRALAIGAGVILLTGVIVLVSTRK